jgi:hypothetical protein
MTLLIWCGTGIPGMEIQSPSTPISRFTSSLWGISGDLYRTQRVDIKGGGGGWETSSSMSERTLIVPNYTERKIRNSRLYY